MRIITSVAVAAGLALKLSAEQKAKDAATASPASGQLGPGKPPKDASTPPQQPQEATDREGWVLVPREQLARVEAWFRDYERQHRAKGTTDGRLKADTNEERADFIRAMLSAVSTPSIGGRSSISSVAESARTGPEARPDGDALPVGKGAR